MQEFARIHQFSSETTKTGKIPWKIWTWRRPKVPCSVEKGTGGSPSFEITSQLQWKELALKNQQDCITKWSTSKEMWERYFLVHLFWCKKNKIIQPEISQYRSLWREVCQGFLMEWPEPQLSKLCTTTKPFALLTEWSGKHSWEINHNMEQK